VEGVVEPVAVFDSRGVGKRVADWGAVAGHDANDPAVIDGL
jgi:hypothetical protein